MIVVTSNYLETKMGNTLLLASTITRSTEICDHLSTRSGIHDRGRTTSVHARSCMTAINDWRLSDDLRLSQLYVYTSSCSFYSRKKKNLDTVQETANSSDWNHVFKFRRRGRDERRSRKFCHFATQTGAHQWAHIYIAKIWIKGSVRSESRMTEYLIGRIEM